MKYKIHCIDTINFEDGRYIEVSIDTTSTEVPRINYIFSDVEKFIHIVPRSVQPGDDPDSFIINTNHYSYFPTDFRISLTSYLELNGIPEVINTYVRYSWKVKYFAADGTEIEKFI